MRYVYLFHEGNARMKELLGGKGANLAEMTNIGLPVPCGMRRRASASGTRMIPCCSRSVPVRFSPCPA